MPIVIPHKKETLMPAIFVIKSSKARVDTTIMKMYKLVDEFFKLITSETILINIVKYLLLCELMIYFDYTILLT